MPAFNRVGKSQLVQSGICFLHCSANPGSFSFFYSHFCTFTDNTRKSAIAGNVHTACSDISCKPFGDSEFVWKNDKTGRGEPPEERIIFGKPGENAMGVGMKKPLWAQVSSNCKKAVVFCKAWVGKLDMVIELEYWHDPYISFNLLLAHKFFCINRKKLILFFFLPGYSNITWILQLASLPEMQDIYMRKTVY